MATKSSRFTSIQTPGAEPVENPESEAEQGDEEQGSDLPPDMQATIDRAIARGIAAGLAQARAQQVSRDDPSKPLPTQEEALEMVKRNGGRSVLSRDGMVCAPPPAKVSNPDADGFSKS